MTMQSLDSRILVSICVPVKNGERVLAHCLDSLLLQSYHNIEVIVVCNGCADATYSIASEYAQKDGRIRAFSLDESGVSLARNWAIGHSNGAYVTFVDADDWVDPDHIERLLETALMFQADLACCGCYDDYPDGKQCATFLSDKQRQVDSNEMWSSILREPAKGYCCNKLFKGDIVRNLRFPETICVNEDTYFCCMFISQASIFAYSNSCTYHYLRDSGSCSMRLSLLVRDGRWVPSYVIEKIMDEFADGDYQKRECELIRSRHRANGVIRLVSNPEYQDVFQTERAALLHDLPNFIHSHPGWKRSVKTFLALFLPGLARRILH